MFLTPVLVSVAVGAMSAQEPPRKVDVAPAARDASAPAKARCLASQLIGLSITNSKDEGLGEIQEIVLDGSNSRIAYAVIAVGGFVGIGEKYLALPWRLIEVTQRGAEGKPRAMLGLDKETLKAAPGFDKQKWPDTADPAWTKQVDDYYRTRGENAVPKGVAEPKGSGADGARGVDRAPASKPFAHRRLSSWIGTQVVDTSHKDLAVIEDLVVDTNAASVDGALLSFGGTLGMGESLVLVANESLTYDVTRNVFMFPCQRAMFESMALPGNKLPPLNTEAWRTRCLEQCALAAKNGNGDVVAHDAALEKSLPFADRYDVTKTETAKGSITTIGTIRVGDRPEERVRLRIRTIDGRDVVVCAAPATWEDQQALGLRVGTVVEVTGSTTQYGNQTVLIAGSMRADGKSLALRDAKGRPTWPQ